MIEVIKISQKSEIRNFTIMLAPSARKILNGYFNLPFAGADGARCPYFNNTRLARRAQLRTLIGKGRPEEIAEEAKIIARQYHAGLLDKDGSEHIRKFLIDHGLGIDCSGFVTQILRAHFKETKDIDLARKLYKKPRDIFRRLVNFLRPVENIGVRTYWDDRNTEEVKSIADIRPLDLIMMMETGPRNDRNHILLVIGTDEQKTKTDADAAPSRLKIKYAHARAWESEGQYGHGVAEGEIKVIKPADGLLEQEWTELGRTGEQNETFLEARQARGLKAKRLRIPSCGYGMCNSKNIS